MYHSRSVLVQVDSHHPGRPPVSHPLRRLRRCVELHVSSSGAALSTATGLPSILQDDTYCVPTEDEPAAAAAAGNSSKELHIRVHAPMRVYILWPALQQPPVWLASRFELVKGAAVKVRWSFSFGERAWLNVSAQRQVYQQQPLLVWQMHKHLPAGSETTLPGPAAAANAGFTAPQYGYVLCMRAQSNTPGGCLGSNGSNVSSLAAKLLLSKDTSPAKCSLQQVYIGLEEGTFDPSQLNPADADGLLKRVMLSGDDELLLMLIEAGMSERCTQLCLQLLLRYAMLEDLPWLAQMVLQRTGVELTMPMLEWLVRELLAASSPLHAEQLLQQYCVSRRNPLSAVAAIKEAIVKAGKAGMHNQQEALQLAARFRCVQHALMHQLLQHCTKQQQQQQQGPTFARQGSRQQQQQQQQLDSMPLQAVLQQCLQETAVHNIGRGSSTVTASIHDCSPYATALKMRDSEFLGLPPVLQYTHRMWQGTELQQMQALMGGDGAGSYAGLGGQSRPVNRRNLGRSNVWQFRSTGSFRSVGGSGGVVGEPHLQPSDWMIGTASVSTGAEHISGTCSSSNNNSRGWSNPATAAGDCSCSLAVPAPGKGSESTANRPAVLPGAVAAGEEDAPALLGSTAAAGKAWQWAEPGPCAEGVIEFEGGGSSSAAGYTKQQTQFSSSGTKSATGMLPGTQTSQTAAATGDIGAAAAAAAAGSTGSTCWLNPVVGVELLQNMGLAGHGSQPLAKAAAVLAHGVLFAPRALYNSPRGRWLMRCAFELFFVLMYQITIMDHMSTGVELYICFPVLVIGNLIDIAFQVTFKYQNNVITYLSDHWSKLDLAVNLGLLGLLVAGTARLVMQLGQDPAAADHVYSVRGLSMIWVVASAFAVLVWARALGILIPLDARLGATLCTMRKAAEEASIMLPMLIVLMLGFGTSLTVVYSGIAPEHNTLAGSLRMLVGASGGDLNMMQFDGHDGHDDRDTFLVVWGQVIMIVYVIVVNILLMTLLIAIINHTYQPSAMAAETVVMHAEAVHHYKWQQRHGLACSPANVFQLLLIWLPHGFRTRVLPSTSKLWVPGIGLDGFVPSEAAAAAPAMLIATGPAEIGYLCFLLFMYPLMAVVAVVALLLHIPFGVAYFARKGHLMWLESSWFGETGRQEEKKYQEVAGEMENQRAPADKAGAQPRQAVGENSFARAYRSSVGAGHGQEELERYFANAGGGGIGPSGVGLAAAAARPGGGAKARRASLMVLGRAATASEAALAAAAAAAGPAGLELLQRMTNEDRTSIAGEPGLVPVQHKGPWKQWQWARPLACCVQLGNWVAAEQLASLGAHVLAAAVGLLAHVVLVVLLVLVLCWAFATRVVFSLYCIFIPTAANHNCCLQQSRQATFWSTASLQAAFAAAAGTSAFGNQAAACQSDVPAGRDYIPELPQSDSYYGAYPHSPGHGSACSGGGAGLGRVVNVSGLCHRFGQAARARTAAAVQPATNSPFNSASGMQAQLSSPGSTGPAPDGSASGGLASPHQGTPGAVVVLAKPPIGGWCGSSAGNNGNGSSSSSSSGNCRQREGQHGLIFAGMGSTDNVTPYTSTSDNNSPASWSIGPQGPDTAAAAGSGKANKQQAAVGVGEPLECMVSGISALTGCSPVRNSLEFQAQQRDEYLQLQLILEGSQSQPQLGNVLYPVLSGDSGGQQEQQHQQQQQQQGRFSSQVTGSESCTTTGYGSISFAHQPVADTPTFMGPTGAAVPALADGLQGVACGAEFNSQHADMVISLLGSAAPRGQACLQ